MEQDVKIKIVKTCAFDDQNPGTSGLRKKLIWFQRPHYVENFVQSIFDCTDKTDNSLLIIGGDGRSFNREVCQKILKQAAANGFGRVMIGKGGLLSTPAVSHLIRKYQAQCGIILSASHNPGGKDGDFGIKYDIGNGGPAPEGITQAIFEHSQKLEYYKIVDCSDIELDRLGTCKIGTMTIDVINPVSDYADLMESLFDFDAIRSAVTQKKLSLCFDAMNAVTGPYAHEIFVNRLGFDAGCVINGTPIDDFGGLHPDPNPRNAEALYDLMMSDKAPDLGAASDGDGDRNMIVGRGIFVSPSDSLAILAANAHQVKAYSKGIVGVARSMPTSSAVDRVAQARGFNLYETPTGWKFFANLLDQGRITLCGEESFGTGSTHLREKDGIWAVLFWLNLMAITDYSVKEIVTDHWREFGRTYYSRHDYENVEKERADEMLAQLVAQLDALRNKTVCGLTINEADNFTYQDPIDQTISCNQGIRIVFNDGARLIFRLSGTGTQGATVRLYFEKYEQDFIQHDKDTQIVLSDLITAAEQLAGVTTILERKIPSLIT